MNNEKVLKDALKRLISNRGRKILDNPIMLDAYLNDLVPCEAEKIQLLIRASADHCFDELTICSDESLEKTAAAALKACSEQYSKSQVLTLCELIAETFSLNQAKITPFKESKPTAASVNPGNDNKPLQTSAPKTAVKEPVTTVKPPVSSTVYHSAPIYTKPKKTGRKVTAGAIAIVMLIIALLEFAGPMIRSFNARRAAERALAKREYAAALPYYKEQFQKNKNNQSLEKQLFEIYSEWTDSLVYREDYSSAYSVFDDAYSVLSNESYIGALKSIDNSAFLLEQVPELDDNLRTIAQYLDNNDYLAGYDLLQDTFSLFENHKDLVGESFALIFPVLGRKYRKIEISFYDVYKSVYYGDFNGDLREGTGTYLFRYGNQRNGEYFYYEGTWKNDKPNGEQIYKELRYEDGSCTRDFTFTYQTEDGIFNGPVVIIGNLNGIVYNGEFVDGIPVSQGTRTTDDFGDVQIYAVSSDGEYWWYFTNDKELTNVHSVYGF